MSLNYRLILLVLRTTPRNNRSYHCLANGTTRTIPGNRLHHFTSPSSSSLSFGNFHKFKSYLLYSCSIRSIHFFRNQQLCRKPSQLNLLLSKHLHSKYDQDKNRSTAMLMTALVVIVLGLSYAAVPLYRIYCQKTGTGLQAVAKVDEMNEKVSKMKKISDRKIRVKFEAEKSSRLAWNFKPSQSSITCSPGETILAFYTAKNELDRPVNGIATYTILPYEAGKYFNKIQCFCFEEQQLNANEEVDLPVFFFIDPEYARDPYLFDVDEIILSYNFFETKEGFKLPKPPSFRAHYPSIPNTPQASAIS